MLLVLNIFAREFAVTVMFPAIFRDSPSLVEASSANSSRSKAKFRSTFRNFASLLQEVSFDFFTLESQVNKIASSWANVQQHMTQFYIGHVKSQIVQIKVTVDLQGCLPKNHSHARRLRYNHRKVYIIVKLIKFRIRRNNFFLRFDLMVSARKPSNAKLTLFA